MTKSQWRTIMEKTRDALPYDLRKAASARIQQAFLGSREYREARVLFCYASMRSEVDTWALIDAALRDGKRLALPRVEPGGVLWAGEVWETESLVRSRFGVYEPPGYARIVPPEEIDVALVPALAFDASFARLGYGGGYYDRYLPKTRALRIGLGYEIQRIERLPTGANDCTMDACISECGWKHAGGR